MPDADIRFVRGDVRPVHEAMVAAATGKNTLGGVSSTGKKLLFVHQFDGFHELLTRLKEANPSVELLGC